MHVQKEIDDWLKEHYEFYPYWVAKLSNEELVYRDERNYRDWLDLKDYCYKNSLDIIEFTLIFRRKKVIIISEPVEGLYFSQGITGTWPSNNNWHYFNTGVLENGLMRKRQFFLPSLDEISSTIEKEWTDEWMIKNTVLR